MGQRFRKRFALPYRDTPINKPRKKRGTKKILDGILSNHAIKRR
jgi:hypothetical protein